MSERPLGLVRETGNPALDAHLRSLDAYDFSSITRSVQQKYGWSDSKAAATARQAKQFLAMPFLDPGYYHIPEADVDEYWHRMILHTVWYHSFCLAAFGEYYHHTPAPGPEAIDEVNRARSRALGSHWFGVNWPDLVMTCTQCKGPYSTKMAGLLADPGQRYR